MDEQSPQDSPRKSTQAVKSLTQHELVQQVHAAGTKFVLVVTGGGSGAISALLSEPGASRSVLEAEVPYAPEALAQWLGGSPPEQYCSERTARAMAMAAYMRARKLAPEATVAGIACTASLASDRPKRGAHRAYIAWQIARCTTSAEIEFRDIRSRAEEEALLTDLILQEVANACIVRERNLYIPLWESEPFRWLSVLASPERQRLLAGECAALPYKAARADELPRALFPGAFNPLHAGHRRMAGVASEILGTPVAYELSIENVDKPLLDFREMDDRLKQFADDDAIWLTRAPTFVRKAELFPGVTFVVGVDTIERVGEERYYGHPAAFERAMESLNAACARFLVFGRTSGDGTFRTLDDVELPAPLADLCTGVSAEVFREDVSSTQLRKQRRAEAASGE